MLRPAASSARGYRVRRRPTEQASREAFSATVEGADEGGLLSSQWPGPRTALSCGASTAPAPAVWAWKATPAAANATALIIDWRRKP